MLKYFKLSTTKNTVIISIFHLWYTYLLLKYQLIKTCLWLSHAKHYHFLRYTHVPVKTNIFFYRSDVTVWNAKINKNLIRTKEQSVGSQFNEILSTGRAARFYFHWHASIHSVIKISENTIVLCCCCLPLDFLLSFITDWMLTKNY